MPWCGNKRRKFWPAGGSCTITNNDVAPSLTLVKQVVNDNGGTVGCQIFNAGMRGQKVTPWIGGPVGGSGPSW